MADYKNKAVRDLAWTLTSSNMFEGALPDAWRGHQGCGAEATAESGPAAEGGVRPLEHVTVLRADCCGWLEELDANPEQLHAWLRATRGIRKIGNDKCNPNTPNLLRSIVINLMATTPCLGIYFGALVEFWLRRQALMAASGQVPIDRKASSVVASVQLTRQRASGLVDAVGQLRFLFAGGDSSGQSVTHLECAYKVFLDTSPGGDSATSLSSGQLMLQDRLRLCVGPFLHETMLDRSHAIHAKQVLASRPEIRRWVANLFDDVPTSQQSSNVVSQLLARGFLYPRFAAYLDAKKSKSSGDDCLRRTESGHVDSWWVGGSHAGAKTVVDSFNRPGTEERRYTLLNRHWWLGANVAHRRSLTDEVGSESADGPPEWVVQGCADLGLGSTLPLLDGPALIKFVQENIDIHESAFQGDSADPETVSFDMGRGKCARILRTSSTPVATRLQAPTVLCIGVFRPVKGPQGIEKWEEESRGFVVSGGWEEQAEERIKASSKKLRGGWISNKADDDETPILPVRTDVTRTTVSNTTISLVCPTSFFVIGGVNQPKSSKSYEIIATEDATISAALVSILSRPRATIPGHDVALDSDARVGELSQALCRNAWKSAEEFRSVWKLEVAAGRAKPGGGKRAKIEGRASDERDEACVRRAVRALCLHLFTMPLGTQRASFGLFVASCGSENLEHAILALKDEDDPKALPREAHRTVTAAAAERGKVARVVALLRRAVLEVIFFVAACSTVCWRWLTVIVRCTFCFCLRKCVWVP